MRRSSWPVLASLIALTVTQPDPRAAQPVVKFAIFPSESIVPCFEDIDWMYTGPVERLLAQRRDAELSYSFFAPGSDKTVLPPIGELWTGNVARREPALGPVSAAARRMQVDAVIMAWVRCSDYSDHPPHLYRVDMYVVDAAQVRRYHVDSPRANRSGEAPAKAIDAFFAGRASATEK